jgi:hypothetical protein
MTPPDPAAITTLARAHLAQGRFGDEYVRRAATIAEPLQVVGLDGRPHSWMVGLTVGDRLVAFFQILLDGTVLRFSSFQRRTGDLAGCPPAKDWLDATSAREQVVRQAQSGDEVGTPRLSFDRNPDRLVWAVSVTRRADGRTRTVYVAGGSVYEPPGTPTFG